MLDRKLIQLKPKEVRVIGEDKKQIGVLSFAEAARIAEQKGLDLMLISSPEITPPVVRIGDMKRIQYEQEKRRPKQKQRDLKEVRITFAESPHELAIRLKRLHEFLEKGHPVQVRMRMRGRQKAHQDFARERLKKFLEGVTIPFKIVQDIRGGPNGLTVVISK